MSHTDSVTSFDSFHTKTLALTWIVMVTRNLAIERSALRESKAGPISWTTGRPLTSIVASFNSAFDKLSEFSRRILPHSIISSIVLVMDHVPNFVQASILLHLHKQQMKFDPMPSIINFALSIFSSNT